MNISTKTKNTGIGSASIPYTGKKIVFDDNGNYPKDSIEHLCLQNLELRVRNQFLEDIIYRACLNQVSPLEEEEYEYININDYAYC